MMRTFVAVLSLGISGGLLQQWFARFLAPIPEKTSTSIATEPIPEATWHREVFGKTILSPSALTLKSSLQSWGKPSVEGWDLLSGPETAAARATLGFWLTSPPSGKVKILSIQIKRPSLSGPILAKFQLRGTPQATLPLVGQLLGPPPAGALTDPLRVSMDAGIDDLDAELEFRIGSVLQMESPIS
jgi:hypothetical protein